MVGRKSYSRSAITVWRTLARQRITDPADHADKTSHSVTRSARRASAGTPASTPWTPFLSARESAFAGGSSSWPRVRARGKARKDKLFTSAERRSRRLGCALVIVSREVGESRRHHICESWLGL